MKGYLKIPPGLVIVMFMASAPVSGAAQKPDYYTLGLKAAEHGNVKKALHIWLQAKDQLKVSDTRIGVAFIKLVTEKNLREYYEFASLMYYWGLSVKKVELHKTVLEQIVERVGVLVEHEIYQDWEEMVEDNNPKIYLELRNFWKEVDLTPVTSYNERLIEHWQRIAYSRKNFNEDEDGAFKADERAKIYIRYGKPHFKRSGILNFNSILATSFVTRVATTPNFGGNPSDEMVQFLVRETRNFYTRPHYEVWIYYPSNKRDEKLIFIFGESYINSFGLIRNVEDFIPARAFTKASLLFIGANAISTKALGNISPALILQMMYYNQLSIVDYYFADLLSDIRLKAVSPTHVVGSHFATLIEQTGWHSIMAPKLQAPQQKSILANKIADIPLEVYTYRLLNKQNKPILVVFLESWPHTAFSIDFANNYTKRYRKLTGPQFKKILSYYQYSNSLQLYNSEGTVISQGISQPVITTEESTHSLAVFTVPALGQNTEMVLSAKLENADSTSTYILKGLPFPNELRGLGKIKVKQPTPLLNDKHKLQMGELIVGYDYRKNPSKKTWLSFTVAHDRTIPIGKPLVIHVEIYHLRQNSNGFGELTLSYQIKPEEGFFGFLDKDQQPLQLMLNIETKTSRYVENLQIKTRKLPPGDYTLMMTATDKQTGRQVQRKFSFEIVRVSEI